MELKIIPCNHNPFPLHGFLIKGERVSTWISEIQKMDLAWNDVAVYPIPGTKAKEIWGCFVLPSAMPDKHVLGKHEACQSVNPYLFIPELSSVYPEISKHEAERLFQGSQWIIHPEFGMYQLSAVLEAEPMLDLPELKSSFVITPEETEYIPNAISTFQIILPEPDSIIQKFEEKAFPKREEIERKPLSFFERLKLKFYKALLKPSSRQPASKGSGSAKTGESIGSKFMAFMGRMADKFLNRMTNKMMDDLADLEERNQKRLDKLISMLKDNPEDALKYAIPLAGDGRGDTNGLLGLDKKRDNFSLWGKSNAQGGSIKVSSDSLESLRSQYNETAGKLLEAGQYEKAAFVYMKLLKDYYGAGGALEKGGFYSEAAVVYLKFAKSKYQAADCFERANMYSEAIEIRLQLNQYEKAGDLYFKIGKKAEGLDCYEKVIKEQLSQNRHIEASTFCKTKLKDFERGQSILLNGWNASNNKLACLNVYLESIADGSKRKQEIERIYAEDITQQNRPIFIDAMCHQYKVSPGLQEPLRELIYELVSVHAEVDPSSVSALKTINKQDKELIKDTIRFLNKSRNNKVS